jgi:hypothetical protein
LAVVLVVTDPTGVRKFLSELAMGDLVSIVTFRDDGAARFAQIDVQPFTQIDGNANSDILNGFLENVYRRDPEDTRPAFRNLSAALQLAIDQFAAPGMELHDGPRAIVMVKADAYVLERQSDVVASANAIGVPIFTIYAGRSASVARTRFDSIASATGGVSIYAADPQQTAYAFANVRTLLREAYRLRIPAPVTIDCDPHRVEVTARGEGNVTRFVPCDTTPDDPHFPAKSEVPLGSLVISDPAAITGIEGPAVVGVENGEYSIGCGEPFTTEPGRVLPHERICVRHRSAQFHNEPAYSILVVGGVPALFESTAASPLPSPPPPPPAPPGGDASGGGGSTGLLELLCALGLLGLARQRCRTYSPGASPSGA